MPTAYTILFLIIILVAVLTWIIPAGSYAYQDDGEPVSGSYEPLPRNGQGVGDVLLSPFEGFYDAIDVAAFILMVGGFLGVTMKTGAITAGIASVAARLRGRERLLIPILMVIFALGGTTFGMAEETIAFYPLLLPVFVAAGYDTVTGVAVILLGAGAGVLGSTVNPFATGIASGFAGVSLGQGLGLRAGILALSLIICIGAVMLYGERVRKDPSRSLVFAQREDDISHFLGGGGDSAALSRKQKLTLWIFGLTFAVMIYSVIPFSDMGVEFLPTLGWWFSELSALFFVGALLVGIFCGMGEEELADSFVSGAQELLGVAFVIGISRGITVVMNNGQITDTILRWGEEALSGSGGVAYALICYLLYLPLSLLIPSTSGLATLSTPIMAPLADFSGVGREIAVTAFQSASGLINLFTPTSAVVMGGLAIGRVPYASWLRFVWKPLILLLAAAMALLALSAAF